MSYRLPSLNGLRAFEAAARHSSFRSAARELRVTPGAVGQHVRALEEALGVRLFERRHRKLALSAAGASYLPAVSGAFGRISIATERIAGAGRRKLVTVGVPADFAAKWLAPNLAKFRALHPGIDVRIVPGAGFADLEQGVVDAVIERRAAPPRDLHSVALLPERRVVVATRRLAATLRRLSDLTLILHDGRSDAWRGWARANAARIDLAKASRFPDTVSMLDAVLSGRGAALVGEILVRHDIEAGRLVTPFRRAWSTGDKYFLCCMPGVAACAEIVAFRTWLRAAVHATRAEKQQRRAA